MHTGDYPPRLGLVLAMCVAIVGLSVGVHLAGAGVNAPPGPGSNEIAPGIMTPTYTAIAVPSPARSPLPLNTRAPTVSARPLSCGMLTDFELFAAWRRGDEAYGTFTQSAEQALSGVYSGKLAYNFPTPGNDYVVFLTDIPMGGSGRAVTAWVYGDNSGHYLNVWVKDAAEEVWSFTFGQIRHVGWQQMVASLDVTGAWPDGHVSGPANGILDYPVNLHALILDDAPDTYVGNGAIYIDDLSCAEGLLVISASTPMGPPVPGGGAGCLLELLGPPDRSSFGPGNKTVTLRWQMDRALAANEYYFVNVPYPHGGSTWYDGSWVDPSRQLPDGTLDTQWVLRDYLCQSGFSDSGWYEWYVQARIQLGAEKKTNDPVSCESTHWAFNWSGCRPTPTPTEDSGPYY